jgi:hypothetical protein
MKIERFEDLECWREAEKVSKLNSGLINYLLKTKKNKLGKQ